MAEDLDGAPESQSSAVPARAAAPLDQRVLDDEQRVLGFQRLHRQVRRVGDVHLDGVHAIADRGGARAAGERLQVHVELARLRIGPREDHGAVRAVARRRHALRHHLREGAEHHVGDALARLRAPRHRRRRPRIDDAALGRGHRDRAIEAAIGRDAGIERRLERVVHRGEEREVHHVDVARALRPAAREVERERIAALRDRDRDGNRLGRDAVVVHGIGVAVHAVGQRGDRGADLALAIGQRLRARRLHGGHAVAVDQLAEPSLTEPVGGDLRPEVAPALVRQGEVGEEQLHHVLPHAPGLDEADRRDPEALVPDGADLLGAAVGVVRDVGHEAEQRAAREDRAHQVDVGQVRAAARVGIVGDEDVARGQCLDRIAREDLADDAQQRAEVHRDVLGLGDDLAVGVEDRGRAVLALLDVGGIGGLDQRGAHLFRDGEEGRADHLERHAVHAGLPCSRMTRKPRSSTIAS